MNKILYRNTIFFQFKKLITFCNTSVSRNASFDLSGVYPPIITTFDEYENISYDKLQYNLEKWKSVPLRGYVVLGTTGEFLSLSHTEKVSLVQYVKDFVSKEKLVIAGTGCETTQNTIELTNKMADTGANAALVVNPCYNKSRMSEDTLYDHFIKVAEHSKIPIILYNVPGNTGIDMSPSLLVKLSDHPNIIGMKESGGDITKIGYVFHKTKDKDFQMLVGSAGFLYSGLCVGCVGGVMALANSLSEEVCELYQLAKNGKHDLARSLQNRLIGPNLCITKWYSIPGVKASMNLKGFYGGPCRSPLKPLTSNEMGVLTKEFKSNGFL